MGSPGQGGLEWLKPNEKHVLGCYWTFRVCTGPPVMFRTILEKRVFSFFLDFSYFFQYFLGVWSQIWALSGSPERFSSGTGPDYGLTGSGRFRVVETEWKTCFGVLLNLQSVHGTPSNVSDNFGKTCFFIFPRFFLLFSIFFGSLVSDLGPIRESGAILQWNRPGFRWKTCFCWFWSPKRFTIDLKPLAIFLEP